MRKFVISLLLITTIVSGSLAQHSSVYTSSDKLFEQGKDLYHQGKFSASFRKIEEFLSQEKQLTAGQIHDAGYLLVANAFELRQDNAEVLLLDFLKQHPYTPYADNLRFMLGMLSFDDKNYTRALLYFDTVKPQRFGQRHRNMYDFAQAYSFVQTDQFARASAIFNHLKELDSPYREPSMYYYAYSEYFLKNYPVALTAFQRVEHLPEYKKEVSYYLFQLYYQSGQTDSLLVKADYLLKNYPDHPNNSEVYRIRGEIAYNAQHYPAAIDFLQKYESLTPRILRHSSYIMGMSYMKTNRPAAAIPYLQQVTTEADALTENAYLHLGHCFVKENDKVNARMAFESVLRTRFDEKVREEALLNYALTTYETTSAFGESIHAFEQYLEEYPNTVGAYKVKNYLASAYMASKNYAVAYESIRRIKNPNEKILEAKQFIVFQLGAEAFALNNFEKAVEYFNLALNERASDLYTAESLYWRSESCYRLGRITNSISDLRSFLANPQARNSKNFVPAHYSMGYAHFSNQNYREARRYFDLYMNMERNKTSEVYADALTRVGDCMLYDRDFAGAELTYSRAANLSRYTGEYALFQSAYVAGLQKKYSTKISRMNTLVESYPGSAYVDEALYETGRAYIMLNNNSEALRVYQGLVSLHPNTVSARKAALETGMIYHNQNQLSDAITAYKTVVSGYPGSVEAFNALERLENIYIELNDVPAYLAYARSLNMNISGLSADRQDSISYIAAEKQYMNANYAQAVTGFNNYLQNYCPGGRYCTNARYFLAESYYRTHEADKALAEFRMLLNIPGNQHMEDALIRSAEISFDKKDFANALVYFRQLEQQAQSPENRNIARLGIMRSAYYTNDYQMIIQGAAAVITDVRSTSEMKTEARYLRAKAYIQSGQSNLAMEDLKLLSAETRTSQGAEASYLLANLYFEQGSYALAEKEVKEFAKQNTPHQYWLARSFVLLADVYIVQKNDFQAKQYLLSLQRNYKEQDDIQQLIESRLSGISQREKAKVSN
ncbi:MAG: tetratricopeptide repeat protein [Paludibacter sp.]|nr:tetratricopeptide repeat protein [Paludibacter sp.]